jgi:cytochrome o ubiquinol oxidase subunit IV
MTTQGPAKGIVLLKAAGAAALIGLARMLSGRSALGHGRRDQEAGVLSDGVDAGPSRRPTTKRRLGSVLRPNGVGHGSSDRPRSGDESRAKRRDLMTYGIGYALALLLTGTAFAVVTWKWAAGATALGIIFALALVQAVVHVRCFLHVDLRRSSRDDLQLILFSVLIIGLMVGGTLVVLLNLRMRMM